MTIEERASAYERDVESSKRKGGDVDVNGNGNYDSIDVFEAYMDGAIDQKSIDEAKWKKVCESFMEILTDYQYDCNVISDMLESFKKKLEEV